MAQFANDSRPLTTDVERAKEDALTLWSDLRRENAGQNAFAVERHALQLTARYRVGDGNEFIGEMTEISARGLRIKGPKSGAVGDWCTANIPSVGIVEGVVVHAREHYFVMGVIATPRRLRRLGQRLGWQLRRKNDGVEERRASERIEMNHARARLETPEGKVFDCEIFDLSQGGAALHLGASALYFWADQPVKLDGRDAHVLRYFPGGVVIKFEPAREDAEENASAYGDEANTSLREAKS